MLDENGLEIEEDINNKVEERITSLSGKVKTIAGERDAEKARAESADTARLAAEKERDFFKDFSTSSSKYPGASEYQDKIKEKVMSGYSVEDAMVSVLAKEGKLTAPQPEREIVAGGSAVNQIKSGGGKTLAEMSRDELKAMVLEAEKKGDISLS